jgi:hypothetical protein
MRCRCLFLYGFCVYHVGRKRKGRDDGRAVLVADHSKITLSFSSGEWIPQFRSDSEPETGRARMIMWRRPSLDFGIDSPAWAGLIPGERLEGLLVRAPAQAPVAPADRAPAKHPIPRCPQLQEGALHRIRANAGHFERAAVVHGRCQPGLHRPLRLWGHTGTPRASA